MQLFTVLQIAAVANFVYAAPFAPRDAEPSTAVRQGIDLAKPPINPALTVKQRVSVAPRPTTTATTTPTQTTTTSAGIFTSVNQNLCSNSYPTGTPDYNQIPQSCGQSWIDIANMWRKAYGLPGYTWSPALAKVAYGAAYNASGGAKPFVHSNLEYWNSSAEVESPGFVAPYDSQVNLLGMTPFSNAIANWMCEVPSDAQLKSTGFTHIDLCTTVVRNIDYIGETPGETGHHDIMLGPYTKMGCAFVWNTQNPTGPFAGIYVCDFQY